MAAQDVPGDRRSAPLLEVEPEDVVPQRRPYSTPRFEVLGDVRGLTLGGSPGGGDSTSPATQNPFQP
jgi:hypothetical protein